MNSVLEGIGKLRLVPVITIHRAEDAEPLALALLEGGLPCAEITFRTDAAEQAIKNIANIQGMLVGAGTVLKVDQVKRAVDAGARFIVSPGLNPLVVEYCVNNDIPVMPGTSTPTDIEIALNFGLEVVKVFPAEALGGVPYLKAIATPYSMMKFMPSGGINLTNVTDYLALPQVLACGGSWMVKSDLIKDGKFEEITCLTRKAVEACTVV